MRQPYRLGSLLALGMVTALPACSMFGGGRERASTNSPQYSQNTYQQSAAMPAPSSVPAGAAVAPMSRDTIREVQQKLAQSGEYHGRPDGVWGPMTERAVRDWQSKNNLNATGMLDAQTLQAMDIASNTNEANNPNNPNNNQNANNNQSANNNPNNPNYSTNPNAGPNTAPNQASNMPYPANQGTPSSNNNNANNPNANNNPNPNAGAGTRAR